MVILHDKLTEFGGSEVVLKELLRGFPNAEVYTSCVDKRIDWEQFFGVPIKVPLVTSWINSQRKYRFFYPLIIFLLSIYRVPNLKKDSLVLVYSSSAAKFFNLKNFSKKFLYSNFPAKPIVDFDAYMTGIRGAIYSKLFRLFLYLPWRTIENRALLKFDAIYTISDMSRNAYLNLFSIRDNSIGVIHCPIGLDIIDAKKKWSPLHSYDGDQPTRLTIISRLRHEKNLLPLLNVLSTLKNTELSVVGAGPLLNELKKIFPKIIFYGFVSESQKISLIKSSHAIVLPTSQEWSMVTVEANVLGVPALLAYSPAMSEINHTISGNYSFPNPIFRSPEEVPNLITKLEESKRFLELNSSKIVDYFSYKRLIKEIQFESSKL